MGLLLKHNLGQSFFCSHLGDIYNYFGGCSHGKKSFVTATKLETTN